MNNGERDESIRETADVLSQIRTLLEQENLLNIASLACKLHLSVSLIREGLEYWVRNKRVEILRPCFSLSKEDDSMDYYRWKADADQELIWTREPARRAATAAGILCISSKALEWAANG